MSRKIYCFIFLVLFPFMAFAQMEIKRVVVDSQQQPLTGAVVICLDENDKLLQGSITDATGMFSITANFAQKEAEMIAYRSQINPHFFFNTLECIRSMAQYYSVSSIEETVTAMSKLFQYSLYSSPIVTFSQELDMLEQYFLITSVRFPGCYKLNKKIVQETLSFPVPSMIIQPLVENSIKHAFKKSSKKGENIIFIQSEINERNQLIISITDNGCGLTEKELARLNIWKRLPEDRHTAKDSIGIQNIFKRIKLFSEHNHINFYSHFGHYTKVVLTLCPMETKFPDQ